MSLYLNQSSVSWAVSRVQMFRGDSLFSLFWIFMFGSDCWECKTDNPVKHMPLTQDRPNSHASVKTAAAVLAYACFHLLSISLFSLSAHCQYDPSGSISHSFGLQHGVGGRLAQPRTYQFTDGGRHRRPRPRQPEQTTNHGGFLLKHPEPSHHFTWHHPRVWPSAPQMAFCPFCGCFHPFFHFVLLVLVARERWSIMKGCTVWCLALHVFNIFEYFSTAWKHTNCLPMFLPSSWLAYSFISLSSVGDSFPLSICFLCIYFAGGCCTCILNIQRVFSSVAGEFSFPLLLSL